MLFLFSLNLKGQDVHYSQFDKTKLLINPSLISNQYNDYEIQLQRRSQWASVTKPFNTFSLSVSTKNIYKNISLGAMILNDVAGDSDFSTDGVSLSFAKAFSRKENLFSISLQTALKVGFLVLGGDISDCSECEIFPKPGEHTALHGAR